MLEVLNVNAQDASSSINAPSIDLGERRDFSLHVKFTGGGGDLAGTLKLQSSNDSGADSAKDWVDVANSSQAVTSSASHVWNATGQLYRYVRVVWTRSAGTGNMTVKLCAKEEVIKGV